MFQEDEVIYKIHVTQIKTGFLLIVWDLDLD